MGLHTPSENPTIKYQLLYDRLGQDDECFLVKEWTQKQLENGQRSGYKAQDGNYVEVGLFDSHAEIEDTKNELLAERDGATLKVRRHVQPQMNVTKRSKAEGVHITVRKRATETIEGTGERTDDQTEARRKISVEARRPSTVIVRRRTNPKK